MASGAAIGNRVAPARFILTLIVLLGGMAIYYLSGGR